LLDENISFTGVRKSNDNSNSNLDDFDEFQREKHKYFIKIA